MKIQFCGAAGSVTGSNYLLETEEGTILIDCGMFQGSKNLLKRNYLDFPYDPKKIDAVIITHAHVDHSGLLPKLVKGGFKGQIYAARPTGDMLEVLLYDSANIEESGIAFVNKRRERKGLPLKKPLFTKSDVTETLKYIMEMEYHQEFRPIENIVARYNDAGHIMGSGFLELFITEDGITKKFVFSGDIGRSFQSFIKNPEVADSADAVFIESTYGNRTHKQSTDTEKEIVAALEEIVKTRGTLLIPAFAVGRTQEMIYKFFELFNRHKIPPVPIIVDSPMGDKVSQIYKENKDLYDDKTLEYLSKGKDPFELKLLRFTKSKHDSKELNTMPGPKIIISSSGMCHGGRIMHHLQNNIWRRNTIVLFVGYQAQGTLGRKIIEGDEEVKIMGEKVAVNCKVCTIGGLSAHADRDELLSWLNFYKDSKPAVFTVHGDPDVCDSFSSTITHKLGLKTYVPSWKDTAHFEFSHNTIDIKHEIYDVDHDFQADKESFYQSFDDIKEYLATLEESFKNSYQKERAELFLKRLNKDIKSSFEEFKSDIEY